MNRHQPGPARPWTRKLAAASLGTVLSLLCFELALQLVAWVIWASGWLPGPPSNDRPTVLCVGDSFTFGMGSSRPELSYPSQLQTMLDDAGVSANVVNAGWPGQSSRDVLLRLDHQMRVYRPKLVYVLIGNNDLGYAPKRVEPGEAGIAADAFPWRLRLLQMGKLVDQWWRGGTIHSQHVSLRNRLIGDWHDGDNLVRIEADGRLIGWNTTLWWYLQDDRLVLATAGRDGEITTPFELDGDTLRIEVPGMPEVATLRRGPPPAATAVQGAHRAADRGEHERALAMFRGCLDDPAMAVAAHWGLVRSSMATADEPEARRHLAWLRDRFRGGDRSAAVPTVQALAAVGDLQEALALARELFDAGGGAPVLEILVEAAATGPGHEQAQEVLADEILQGGFPPAVRAHMMRMHGLAIRDREPRAAMELMLRAELASPMPELIARMVADRAFAGDVFEQCLAAMDLTPAQRDQLTAAAQRTSGHEAALDNYAYHCRLIVELCRHYGAQACLLTYPTVIRSLDPQIHSLGESLGVKVVDVARRFEQLRDTTRWESLFNIDGHCNDGGYRVVAEAVLAHALGHLR